MKTSGLTARCFFVALLSISAWAHADLIAIGGDEQRTPGRFDALHKRLAEHPNAVDRADAFCDGRPAGATCVVPGSAFDGGGAGVCMRKANLVDERIDETCEPRVTPVINRGLPSGPWQPEASFCARRPYGPDSMAVLEWQCEPPVEVFDRFCSAASVGDRCVVEGALGGAAARFEGVCTKHVESKAEESIGVLLSRPVVTCESVHPSPRDLITYGVWRKLFQ